METLIATAGNLINVLPAPLKALTAEVVSRISFISSIFWSGWVVVPAALFVSRGSEHVEDPQNNF